MLKSFKAGLFVLLAMGVQPVFAEDAATAEAEALASELAQVRETSAAAVEEKDQEIASLRQAMSDQGASSRAQNTGVQQRASAHSRRCRPACAR